MAAYIFIAVIFILSVVLVWTVVSGKARMQIKTEELTRMARLLEEKKAALAADEAEIGRLTRSMEEKTAAAGRMEAELIRKEAEIRTCEQLRKMEKDQHDSALAEVKASYEQALADLKAGREKALEAARTALALENEKALKVREETLKKEAAETMKVLTGDLNKDIRDMKEAFEAQKKMHAEESSSIRTQFAETVRNLREQAETIGSRAENLANALKGKNKMQGIFGETILENILREEGLREGHDYDAECWLRDKNGNRIVNEETGRKMRPDFALHFPDKTDVLIDAKVSLSALSDWFGAQTEEQRADAARRNLESVLNHVEELAGKEYQKYVVGRKTLDYVIMFIPNYGAYQLAKMEDKEIFAKAFRRNVLITTEETLIPFLRLIRTAWVQKEQIENISGIVKAAQDMVDRVGLFCQHNAALEENLENVLDKFKANSKRLVDGNRSIVKAARRAIAHGIQCPDALKELLPNTEEDSVD